MAPLPANKPTRKIETMPFPQQPEPAGHMVQAIDRVEDDRQRISFMDLAVEIRLRVYEYVYESHSIRQSKLPLWYLTQGSGRHVLKPVTAKTAMEASSPCSGETPTDTTTTTTSRHSPTRRELLSAHRPMNYIPTALLLACRQVYYEARMIPFHENEFVFPAWHGGGGSLEAAKYFLSNRLSADWQRQSMRYMRIDLDLSNWEVDQIKEKTNVWKELCSVANWGAGLRGMRLCIDCKDKDLIKGSFGSLDASSREGGGPGPGPGAGDELSPFAWIFRGLVKLKALRHLDVEIKRGKRYMTDDEKVGWCRLLEELLNEYRERDRESCERVDEGKEGEWNLREEKVSVMCAQTSYDPFNLEQVFGKISYPMMVWPLYAGF